MNYLALIVLLILNTAISWLDAWAAGRMWTESKIVGGWTRAVTWCAVVMAVCGFTWVILTLLTIITIVVGYFEPIEAEVMFKLGYLIVILPIVGSGFGLWIDSLVQAYKRKDFGTAAIAAWNTYAQFRNVYTAARNAPGVFTEVIEFFGKSKSGRKLLAIALFVLVSLGGGILITAAIVRKADRDHVEDFISVIERGPTRSHLSERRL